MKTCTLIVTSKNLNSLHKLFFGRGFQHFPYIVKCFQKKKVKKIITILKSPHVNKKAQEQFEIKYYSVQFSVNSIKLFKFLIFLKKVKTFCLSDINIKIKTFFNKKKQELLNTNIFNINNFKIKSFIRSNYNVQIFKLKMYQQCNKKKFTGNTNLSTKNMLKLFDLYGN